MERLRGCAAGIEGVVSREPRARPSSAPKVYPPRAPLVPVKGSLERANDVIKGGSSRTRRDETVPFFVVWLAATLGDTLRDAAS